MVAVEAMLKRVSVFDLNVHDFRRLLRVGNLKLPIHEVLKSIVHERRKAIRSVSLSIGIAMLLSVWLRSSESELTLTIELIGTEFSLQTTLVILISAVLLVNAFEGVLSFLVLDQFTRLIVKPLDFFGYPEVAATLFDGFSAPVFSVPRWRFSTADNRSSKVAHWAWLLLGLSIFIALPIALIYAGLVVSSLLLLRNGVDWLDAGIIGVTLLASFYPWVRLWALFSRRPIEKNKMYTRRFLFWLHRKYSIPFYPRVIASWISESEAKKRKPDSDAGAY